MDTNNNQTTTTVAKANTYDMINACIANTSDVKPISPITAMLKSALAIQSSPISKEIRRFQHQEIMDKIRQLEINSYLDDIESIMSLKLNIVCVRG